MSKLSYQFYPIPKVVFHSQLSPCAKLLFTYLASVEVLLVSSNRITNGAFFSCYLSTLAKAIGKSTDSVRKSYIPELISTGYLEKKHLNEHNEGIHRTDCLYRIRWEVINNLSNNKL